MNTQDAQSQEEKLIVYIDGFNLYHGLHAQFGTSMLWLDLIELSRSLRPNQNLVAVKYFTAPVLNEPDAQARQAHYINALQSLYPDIFHVIQGRYQTKTMVCRSCSHTYVKYEEKETDVNIAVSLVADTALELMDTALIVSADSDLAPAVKAAKGLSKDLFIAAAFPPRRNSSELKRILPNSFRIGDNKIRQNQLDETFTIKEHTYMRPVKWS
jgi:uncharacterized LabA/DUF88 family protein